MNPSKDIFEDWKTWCVYAAQHIRDTLNNTYGQPLSEFNAMIDRISKPRTSRREARRRHNRKMKRGR